MPKTEKNVVTEGFTLSASSSPLDFPVQTITVNPPENNTVPFISAFTVVPWDFQLGLTNEEKEALRDELKRFNWMSNALREKLIKRLS